MSLKNTLKISLAFVGLLVGAGFATGQEVIQYFGSFGLNAIWGSLLAGLIMTAAGAVILQIGSYFLAQEHRMVFHNLSHPIVSRFLDLGVTFTLFAVGFVMLAGAGSNLEEQFGWPAWVGSLIMLILVMVTGLMDVDRVSSIISTVTPLIIVAVLFAFGYTLFNMPDDFAAVGEMATQAESPISPWWLSALNYTGLALLLGLSMALVIGGNNSKPREAGVGGLMGGLIYLVMLMMATFALLANFEVVGDSSVPMLALIDHISHPLSYVMVVIIFIMIYNTCIGMFYALGRRLTANHPDKYRPVFLTVCLVGFGVSFFGFESLMANVYPIIGWVGLLTIAVLVAWWIKSRVRISREGKYRERATELVNKFHEGEEELSEEESHELKKIVEKSNVGNRELAEALTREHKEKEGQDTSEKDDATDEGDESGNAGSGKDSQSDSSEGSGGDKDADNGEGSEDEKVDSSTQELMDELDVDWERGQDSELKES